MSEGDKFPVFSTSARTGEDGVGIVDRLISQDFRWIFRRTHQEHDFGVDGHIEIVQPTGEVTGRSFAVQIKCGKSYLSETNDDGYIYRGQAKHLNYLANYPIPVILILCDPNGETCWWEEFSVEKTTGSDTGWTITIPFDQEFTTAQHQILEAIAGPAIDITDAASEFWEMNRLVGDTVNHITFVIDKKDVASRNPNPIANFFARLQVTSALSRKNQGKVDIGVHGYDDDPRELWEIPEVRHYFAQVEPIVKYWFYFLSSRDRAPGLRILLANRCRYEKLPDGRWIFDKDDFSQFLYRNFAWLNEIADRLRLPRRENERISESVVAALKNPKWPSAPKLEKIG